MNVAELIGMLEELAEDYGDDVNVRVAIQQNWPLAERISNVSVQEENDDHEGPVLWIATQPVSRYERPYAPSAAWGGEYD